jgi:uncharacterized membrane protein
MHINYNRLAGTSIERLAALSDGIFAVAMTLLVLDLKTPVRAAIHSDGELLQALGALTPEFMTFFLSVVTLGIFWIGQQAILNSTHHGDRNFSWINLAFLASVSLIPFATRLLTDFFTYRAGILIYWLNLVSLGGLLYAAWRYAHHANLLREETSDEIRCAIERRILRGQGLYALGALLCLWDNRASLVFIVCAQIYFVAGPSGYRVKRSVDAVPHRPAAGNEEPS